MSYATPPPFTLPALVPDSRLILTACEDDNARLWQENTGTNLATLKHVFYYDRVPHHFPNSIR
jgi:hypothetical protein